MRWFIGWLLFAIPSMTMADVPSPGQKRETYIALFENTAEFRNYVFYIWPREMPRDAPGNSSVRLKDDGTVGLAGNPAARTEAGGVFLFAIPKKLFGDDLNKAPKDEWFDGKGEGVLKSKPLPRVMRWVDGGDPRNQFVDRYRIELDSKESRLDAIELSDERPSGSTAQPTPESSRQTIVIGMGIAALVLVAGWMIVRMK